MAEKYLSFDISKDKLEEHVRRICKGNLRRNVELCRTCPILEPVLGVMDNHGWKYDSRRYKI